MPSTSSDQFRQQGAELVESISIFFVHTALIDVHLGMFCAVEFGEPVNVSHLVAMFEAQKSGILPDTSVAIPLELVN